MKRFLLRLAALAILASGASLAAADGGKVLPPSAAPSDYSLEDMADEMAYFSTSGNDLDYYPDTPFQILYISATNTFTVKTGTTFFVPIAYIDNSPPIIGDFPDRRDDIAAYVFSPKQLGAHDLEIIVDGRATTLGPEYAAGVYAPGLLDGGGSHFIQIGAFLTPLSKGTHTVTIQGTFDGDAFLDFNDGSPYSFENTYTVIVKD